MPSKSLTPRKHSAAAAAGQVSADAYIGLYGDDPYPGFFGHESKKQWRSSTSKQLHQIKELLEQLVTATRAANRQRGKTK